MSTKMRIDIDRLVALHAQGMSWDDMGKHLGCSASLVRRTGGKLGLSNAHMSGGDRTAAARNRNRVAAKQAAENKAESQQRQGPILRAGVSTLPPLASLQMPLPAFSEAEGKGRR